MSSEVAPSIESAVSMKPSILRVEDLAVHFPVKGGALHRKVGVVKAVDGVSLEVRQGETLGLVGESGCGKSTTIRSIVRLADVTAGRIIFDNSDVSRLRGQALKEYRSKVQFVFQDPFGSLNPRASVHEILAEPLRAYGRYRNGGKSRIIELLEMVGLAPEHERRTPLAFSGGQRQRIGIARALALDPKLILLDEPVSALDVSIQAQIINLLRRLQTELDLTYVFVSHDLSVIRHISDRIGVMYLGRIVETGPTHRVFSTPTHPYTRALLSATPIATPKERGVRKRIILTGDVPSPVNPPSGCRFRTRCWKATDLCAQVEPPLVDRGQGQMSACHFPE